MNLKFRFIVMIFFASFLKGFSQQYKYLYYLDENLNAVEKSKSILTGKAYYDSSGLKIDCFNKDLEKLMLTATFTDSTLNDLQGAYTTYYADGKIAWHGNYIKNEKEGLWQQWNEKGFKTDSIMYEKSNRVRFAKFSYYQAEKKIYSYNFTDSLANTYTQLNFYKNGNLSSEVAFVGQKGLLKSYDNTSTDINSDSVFTREEMEATFPGGDLEWRNYLRENLNPDVPANNGAGAGKYVTIIKFKVAKDGKLIDVEAETNIGYGAEKEVIRLIKKSPKWIPARQYGRFVIAYRRQPITFEVNYRR